MTHSNNTSTPPSNPKQHPLVFVMLGLALVGFLDSVYLTIEHFLNSNPPCSIVSGCERVVNSEYSIILGIPLALMGALFYFAVILALVYYLDTRREWVIKWTARSTAISFLISLWLVYLMLFVIKAICIYCMVSALSSTALFIIGLLVLRSLRSHTRGTGAPLPRLG